MIRIGILAAIVLAIAGNSYAQQPIVLTECGTIAHPGNYVFGSDIVLTVESPSSGGDCLIVSSSHVNIDMGGMLVTAECPMFPSCVDVFGPVAGTGIHIVPGADHVSVSNGSVEGFSDGVIVEADHATVSNVATNAPDSITLNGVSYSTFSNVTFATTPGIKYAFGYVASVNGGGHNSFTNLNEGGADNRQGLLFSNSSYNVIDGASIFCGSIAQAGPGILLTQGSNHNSITNASITVLFGNGIEIDAGSGHNIVEANTVNTESPASYFDLLDENPQCDHDVWSGNVFTSASPSSCIN
jgi:hypothetical protein